MSDHALPVDSLREAAPYLRRPFTPAAVKFKVQATWQTGGLIVAYIDARLVAERLNLVCPHLWHDAYRSVGQGQMWCDLTIDGITRSDVGEGTGKGLVSDAFKRAAVKFGIGVPLYAVPAMTLNNQHLERKQRDGGKEQVKITPDGERVVRGAYAAWLEQHGKPSFGEPFDHGDVEGAQGDHEADPSPEPVAPVEKASVPKPSDVPTEDVWLARAQALIRDIPLTTKQVREGLLSIGEQAPDEADVRKLVPALSDDKRLLFMVWLTEQAAKGTPLETAA